MTAKAILGAALQLKPQTRIALAHEIWDSVPEDEFDDELSDEFKAELDARIKHAEAHPEEGITWEELKAQLLGKGKMSSHSSSRTARKKISVKRSTGMKFSKSA